MAQFKVYGRADALRPVRRELSDLLHGAAVDVLGLPEEKRFHRFFPMDPEDFPIPAGRSHRYTVVEVVMFPGRSVATKKAFLRRLFGDAREQLGLEPVDLEVVLLEPPRHDWGIRGLPGDELDLSYRVDV